MISFGKRRTPPFQKKREVEERRGLLKEELDNTSNGYLVAHLLVGEIYSFPILI